MRANVPIGTGVTERAATVKGPDTGNGKRMFADHPGGFSLRVRDDDITDPFFCHEGGDIHGGNILRNGKDRLVGDVGESRFDCGYKDRRCNAIPFQHEPGFGVDLPAPGGTYLPGSERFLKSAYPITLAMLSVSGWRWPKQ